jgi:large repetitive protein
MWFRKLFDSLKSGGSRTPIQQARRGPPRRQPAACRLAIEALEDRCVPASLTVSDVSILEGNAGTRNALVTVTLTGSSNPTVSVVYSTANGTAVAGSDYQAVSGTLTFTKGVTSKSILVPVIGDTLVESNEAFFVNLKNAKHATIADGQGAVTIVNDDAQISIGDVTLKEGNSGTTNFVFTVSLSAASGQPVTVNYATANGTAAVGSDYDAKTGTLTIPAGQTSGTITVLVNGDQLGESDETFFVNLSSPTNATIADGQGVGTIVDDEPRINIAGWSSAEGNAGTTEFTFTVTLSAASDVSITVDFATADDTAATADNDYVAASGSLTFAPGELSKTVTVLVNGDLVVEYDEYFVVNLSNATNAQLSNSQVWGTILTDDNPLVSISDSSGSVWQPYPGETTYISFTVTLSAPSSETVTVDYYTIDGSATANYDYVPSSGTLSFAPGETSQTFSVEVLGGYSSGYDKTFYVSLSGTSSNALIQPGWGTGAGTIWDNEYYGF